MQFVASTAVDVRQSLKATYFSEQAISAALSEVIARTLKKSSDASNFFTAMVNSDFDCQRSDDLLTSQASSLDATYVCKAFLSARTREIDYLVVDIPSEIGARLTLKVRLNTQLQVTTPTVKVEIQKPY